MSYSCMASFKKLPNDINTFYDFISQLKLKATEPDVIKSIITDNEFYCPLSHIDISNITAQEAFNLPELEYWITRLFTYKWKFLNYNNETFLCILGIPDQMTDLFDTTIYFQNSTDQDYEIEDWKLDTFIQIYNKWHDKSFDEVISFLYDDNDIDQDEINKIDESYFRRCAAYKEIASPIESLLYNDKSSHYIQLFRSYDNTYELRAYKKAAINLNYLSEKCPTL